MSSTELNEKALKFSKMMLPDANVDAFLARYAFIKDGSYVVDIEAPPPSAVSHWKDFQRLVASCQIDELQDNGKIKRIPVSQLWMESDRRITLSGFRYDPGAERENFCIESGAVFFNTFFFPPHDETDDSLPSLFYDHMAYLFGDQVEGVLDYFAHITQRPQERPAFVLYNIATEHGTGRGWLDQLMVKLLGHWNCSQAKVDTLVKASAGSFSNFYDSTLWCNVPEVRAERSERYEVDDKLRDVLTDKMMLINPKFGKQHYKNVYTRTFLCTNHIDGLIVPEEDRRIWATRVQSGPKSEKDYKALYAEVESSHFVSRIFTALKNRDISGFHATGRAPQTKVKREIIAATRSEMHDILTDIDHAVPAHFHSIWHPEVATFDQLATFLRLRDERKRSQLMGVLRHSKTTYYGGSGDGRVKWRGKPVRVWILKNRDRWESASKGDVRAELDRLESIWEKASGPFDDDDPAMLEHLVS